MNLTVLELTGEVTPDLILLKKADILVVTPEKWDGISRGRLWHCILFCIEAVLLFCVFFRIVCVVFV